MICDAALSTAGITEADDSKFIGKEVLFLN